MLPGSSTQGYHVSQYIFPRTEVFLNHVHLIHFTVFLISVSVGGHPEVLLYITSICSDNVTVLLNHTRIMEMLAVVLQINAAGICVKK